MYKQMTEQERQLQVVTAAYLPLLIQKLIDQSSLWCVGESHIQCVCTQSRRKTQEMSTLRTPGKEGLRGQHSMAL